MFTGYLLCSSYRIIICKVQIYLNGLKSILDTAGKKSKFEYIEIEKIQRAIIALLCTPPPKKKTPGYLKDSKMSSTQSKIHNAWHPIKPGMQTYKKILPYHEEGN